MAPSLPSLDLRRLRPVVQSHLSWDRWARCIESRGVSIDRPAGSAHPDYPSIIYPLDYGFIPGTVGSDGDAIDAFVGGEDLGLVGTILTTDHRQKDREVKLLIDCSPVEIYTAHGFINYDRTLLEGVLVLRSSMRTLWERTAQ